MNSVLEEIERSGQVRAADSEPIQLHSHVSGDETTLMRRMVAKAKPRASVEVGLAFGISAMHVCDALAENGCTGTHHVIDPMQNGMWKGIGLLNLKRAGFEDRIDFLEKSSHLALPELETRGVRADFVVIDGWHTFDHTLVDFFLADKLLNVGGIMVIDDMGMPAVRKVGRFMVTNRGYQVIGTAGEEEYVHWKRWLLNAGAKLAGPIAKPELRQADSALGIRGTCIAFQKTTDDTRDWKHYRLF